MNYRWIMVGAAAVVFSAVSFVMAEPYDTMAKELSDINVSSAPKIAIIPFTYVDKRKSDAGVVISERLTTRIVKLKTCKVIERELLEGVMAELHLETTGVVDAETTRKLGKVLGVDAIITGTLMDTSDGKVEVNARTINTETAELLNTCSVEVKKTWSDTPAQPAPAVASADEDQDNESAQPAQPMKRVVRNQNRRQSKGNGFFDIFVGGASGNMDLTFHNPGNITGSALNLAFSGTYDKLEFSNVQTAQSFMPIGLRVGGFGGYLGGDMEMSFFSQHLSSGKTQAYFNGSSAPTNFDFYVDDYLQVDVFTLLSGDLMLRFSKGVIQPYIGAGIGLTLDNISSPYIYGYSSGYYGKGFNEMAVGFLFRVPMGVRFVFSPTASFFIEYRPTTNTFSFSRGGVTGESDIVSMTLDMLMVGAGFRF